MTNESLFRLLTFLLISAAFATSGYFRRKAERDGGQLNPGGKQLLLGLLRLLGLIAIAPLLIYLIRPELVAWARFDLPLWARWSGALVALLTIPVFIWIFRTLGANITPTHYTRRGHRLIKNGPYRWVRHPLYTTGLIFYAALTLLSGVWWTGIGLLAAFGVLVYRTSSEEAQLLEMFGDEYRSYMESTGRFIPRAARQ